jgi:hypothetical protein
LFVTWENLPTDPSGLSFSYNTIYVNGVINQTITNADNNYSAYIYPLLNGTSYSITVSTTYTDNGGEYVETAKSSTVPGMPMQSPSQPSDLTTSTSTNDSVTLSWLVPSQLDTVTNYSIYLDGSCAYSHIPLSDISYNNNRYDYLFHLTPVGVKYNVELVAESLLNNGTYSVSQPATATVTSYTQPGTPGTSTVVVNNSKITYNWTPPSDSGGAGQGGNGPLMYNLYIYNASDLSNALSTTNYSVVNPNQGLTTTVNGLTNNTYYIAQVQSTFLINGTTQSSKSAYATFASVTPTVGPNTSYLIASPNSTGEINISWGIDNSFNAISAYSGYTLFRTIQNSLGVKIVSKTAITPAAGSSATALTYTDSSGSTGTSSQFINGNQMIYDLTVNYGPSFYSTYPTTLSTIPRSTPYPCNTSGVELSDASCIVMTTTAGKTNCVATVCVNGSNLISYYGIGMDASLVPYVINNITSDPSKYTITQTNPSYPNVAINQIAQITFKYDTSIGDILGIFSNSVGSLTASSPPDGMFEFANTDDY